MGWVPEPHWFEVSDFAQFLAEWRANFIRELSGIKMAFDVLNSLTALPADIDEKTYHQALPHFHAALTKFQAASMSIKDLLKLLIKHSGEPINLMRFGSPKTRA